MAEEKTERGALFSSGCCLRYTDAISSYLHYEIDLVLICFCKGQLLEAVSSKEFSRMAVPVCCAGSTRCILKTLASESGAKILFTWTIHQIPVVAESLGGWKKLVSVLAGHTE